MNTNANATINKPDKKKPANKKGGDNKLDPLLLANRPDLNGEQQAIQARHGDLQALVAAVAAVGGGRKKPTPQDKKGVNKKGHDHKSPGKHLNQNLKGSEHRFIVEQPRKNNFKLDKGRSQGSSNPRKRKDPE
jgi:hypothetical protein